METIGTPLFWTAFAVVVVAMLALDLGVFHRRAHTVTAKEAAIWSCVWVAISLAFNAVVAWRGGGTAGEAFLTGYIIEKALSVDNLFVFYVIFSTFRVPDACQHRLLFWGIVGALALRAGMVFGGTWLLSRFQFLFYVFGGVLILTGLKMFRRQHDDMRPEEGRVFKLLRRIIPTTPEPVGCQLLARSEGGGGGGPGRAVLRATPLLLVLLLIEATDIVFALDSILAIFAVTTDPFIVLTSNVFAVMGMRSLYFLLASLARRFVYLQPGLALVLLFVGAKMALSSFVHIPVVLSLAVVALLLGGSVVASLIKTRREKS